MEYEDGINMTYLVRTGNGYECAECKAAINENDKRCPACRRIVVSEKFYNDSVESGFTIMVLPAKD